jgi:hypothetical protein
MANPTASNTPRAKTGSYADVPVTTRNPTSNPFPASMKCSAETQLMNDVCGYLKNYAKERPEVAALWCFGIGFIVGWKLKPW